jgi:hypothetical protein
MVMRATSARINVLVAKTKGKDSHTTRRQRCQGGKGRARRIGSGLLAANSAKPPFIVLPDLKRGDLLFFQPSHVLAIGDFIHDTNLHHGQKLLLGALLVYLRNFGRDSSADRSRSEKSGLLLKRVVGGCRWWAPLTALAG